MSDLTNSLDLDPQDGDLELLEELEEVFAIKFEPEETRELVTVGDLHDLLARKMPLLGGKKCRTQMAFYRLRKALTVMSPQSELRPATNLSRIGQGAPRMFFRVLERASGLRLPSLPLTRVGIAAWLLLFFAFVGLIVFSASGGGLASFMAAGLAFGGMILVAQHDRGVISEHLVTLGDLAKATSAKNYAMLSNFGGRQSNEELWSALIELLAELSGALRKDEIKPSTTLFVGSLDK
jgi:hypothetical protein